MTATRSTPTGTATATSAEPAFKPKWISVESWGLFLLAFSAVLFSLMGTFVKLAASTGLPSTELVFFRAVFQGLLVVFCMAICKAKTEAEGGDANAAADSNTSTAQTQQQRSILCTPFGGKPEVKKIVLLRGAVGSLGFINFYYTMSALPIGDAIALLSLYPMLTIFVARLYLGESIRIVQVLAALASVTGAILISRPTFIFGPPEIDSEDTTSSANDVDPLGYVTAILGSCCASAVVVLIRKAGNIGAHTLQLLFSWCTFGILLSLIFGAVLGVEGGDSSWHMPASEKALLYVCGVCIIGSVAHFILNYAARLAPAGLSAIARASDIVYGYLWEIFVFKQKPFASTLVGVVLIALSLIGIAIQKTQDEKNKSAAKYELVQQQTGGGKTGLSSLKEIELDEIGAERPLP